MCDFADATHAYTRDERHPIISESHNVNLKKLARVREVKGFPDGSPVNLLSKKLARMREMKGQISFVLKQAKQLVRMRKMKERTSSPEVTCAGTRDES